MGAIRYVSTDQKATNSPRMELLLNRKNIISITRYPSI